LERQFARDPGGVTEQLLDRWRTHRHAVLAEVIVALPGVKLGEHDVLSLKRAWREPEVRAVAEVTAALFSLPPRDARAVFRRRSAWQDDPRVVNVLLHHLEVRPARFEGTRALPFWGDVLRFLATVPMQGLHDRLHALQERVPAFDPLLPALVRWRPAAVEASEPVELAELEVWLERLHDREGSLLEAFLRDPTDLTALAVLGDQLLEDDDPRGAAIAAGMAGAGEVQPTPAQRRRWLGVLAALVRSPVFRRGFVVSGVLRAEVPAGVRDADEWRTLEHLDLGSATRGPDAAVLSSLTSVRFRATRLPVLHPLATLNTVRRVEVELASFAWLSHVLAWDTAAALSVRVDQMLLRVPHTGRSFELEAAGTLDVNRLRPLLRGLGWQPCELVLQPGGVAALGPLAAACAREFPDVALRLGPVG
jgi:hypothetical protein